MTVFSLEDVRKATLKYFDGDEIATDVWIEKYALRNSAGELLEKTPDDMHRRLAREFSRIEKKYPNPMSEDDIYVLLKDFKYIVPQGSPMSAVGNVFKIQSLSNCFVIPPPLDSYGSIARADEQILQIQKRRGGVGVDLSEIRPRGLGVANAAGSSDGIGIFMERYSNTTREVAQGGRRGALMETIDVRHPDVETFITMKQDLKKVTGANVSVRITDEFMNAVESDSNFVLRWPVLSSTKDALMTKTARARHLWNLMMQAAWTSAEPGILYWDTVARDSMADEFADKGFKTVCTNPCFVGSTLVAVADGRNAVTFAQLAEEGKDVPVYSTNPFTGQVEIKMGRFPRCTGKNREVLKVTLDDGSTFSATPEHLIMLSDRSYRRVDQLQNGDSLTPFNSFESNGYRQICNSGLKMLDGAQRNRRQYRSNEHLVQKGKELFQAYGYLTKPLWRQFAKENGLPQEVGHKFLFGSWSNFRNQVAANHKVVSVESAGVEDVYDLKVDDNENFFIITSYEDSNFVVSSGVCVHNCSELPLSAYDSCRLLLLNLFSYVKNPFTKDASFDEELFANHCQKAQRLMDDLVDLEIEAIDRIIKKVESDPEPETEKVRELSLWKEVKKACEQGRRTGTGITALGDAISALGVKYGTKESIELTEKMYKCLALNAHASSVQMAIERGPFPAWEPGRYNNPFAERLIKNSDQDVNEKFFNFGRRNIALTTTAPAGSVSILTQTTSGIEPPYLLHYKRRKKVTDQEILNGARVDFVDELGDRWQEYDVFHPGVKRWMEITGETDPKSIEKSPYWGSTSNDIDWIASVDLLASAQRWTEHSISKTINLPKSASVELVSEVYMRAWKAGIKGVTVYRDGSRSGVLVSSEEKKENSKENQPNRIVESHAPKRPKELPCEIHRVKVNGEDWTIVVGLFEGKPYEVFGGLSKFIEIPKKRKQGRLVKNGKINGTSAYNIAIPIGDDEELVIKDVVSTFDNPTFGSFTRMLSLSLRHGISVSYVVEQLQKQESDDMQSFSRVIARVLKNYIKDGTKLSKKCPSCGGNNMSYQEGCMTCHDCGWSKCG